MSRQILTLFFLNIFLSLATTHDVGSNDEVFITELEKKLEVKLIEYAESILKWLENINDKNLNNSDLGKMLHYNEIKSKLEKIGSEARGKKLLPLVLIPIVFKIGAMTTWMILTTLLTAKSVAIGLLLLLFKIIVTSAKLSSFFTIWKYKKYLGEFHSPAHHDHHVHSDMYHHAHAPDWSSHSRVYVTAPPTHPGLEYAEIHNNMYHHAHTPDWSPHSKVYVTAPPTYPGLEYAESKKSIKKHS